MTTTVHVLIQGNKNCEVKVIEADGSVSTGYPPREVAPGSFTMIGIHGEQQVSVKEVGVFVS